ncbi:MRP-L47-domain-containing protein [Karstenula rhodostoma CBS 690.94]|uniref:Large ribosomal subunit protein uL29m n=1 Tax=Karstenula rhodostoma CBS 690.94 TaxID=1392251 RepID=A0A9P4U687_9PLEO|nr:MRP-L47-domain-containing protein [Karstenula rhodostoma CBS 690.94]
MAIPTSRILRPSLTSAPRDTALSLFASSAQCTRRAPLARFSTSPSLLKGPGRGDNNKNRGVSGVRHTGLRPRQTLSVKRKDYENQKLPTPVQPTSQISGDPEHGLYGFFKDKKLLLTPVEEGRHGRAWTVNELRNRDWETLQQLWWVCVRERNRLATAHFEHRRQGAGHGKTEMEERDETIQETMKAILDTLAERNTAYEEAYKLAKHDPTIDLGRPGHQYQESSYDAEDMYQEDDNLSDPNGVIPKEASEGQPPQAETISVSQPSTVPIPEAAPSKELPKQPNAS